MKILEDWKIKAAVLWFIVEGTYLGYIILTLMEPGVLEVMMAEEIAELFLIITIGYLIPLIMALLSLTLKNSTNRWANIILGIVFTVIPLVALGEAVTELSAWAILNTLSGVVASALIVWYAWKSKQKA